MTDQLSHSIEKASPMNEPASRLSVWLRTVSVVLLVGLLLRLQVSIHHKIDRLAPLLAAGGLHRG